jgi:bla regulator protein blaR1
MIIYLIKTILCSCLFIGAYKLLLEKEKMHRFNRFFLLCSLACSFLIPLLTFPPYAQPFSAVEQALSETIIVAADNNALYVNADNGPDYFFISLLIIYLAVTLFLLFRFLINLLSILRRTRTTTSISYNNCNVIVMPGNTTAHSFLQYIFISQEDYENESTKNKILLHESAHVQQKHSLDILFIEAVRILFWFNPVLFIYRKAFLLNHEFLADESVLTQHSDVRAYQILLLEKASRQTSSFVTSQFNYSITKKRILMMTKARSFRKALCKQIAMIPVLGISLFLFSTKTIAQDTTRAARPEQAGAASTKNGISSEQLTEYLEMVNRVKNEKGIPVVSKFSEIEKNRLETLFLLMSKEQQEKQTVIFMPAPPPLPTSVPSKTQMEAWKNAKVYGIWINGKRTSNAALNNYINTDFAQVFVSKLAKTAINYGKHYYQVDLMTTDYYAAYYKQATESKKKYFMAIRLSNKKKPAAENSNR